MRFEQAKKEAAVPTSISEALIISSLHRYKALQSVVTAEIASPVLYREEVYRRRAASTGRPSCVASSRAQASESSPADSIRAARGRRFGGIWPRVASADRCLAHLITRCPPCGSGEGCWLRSTTERPTERGQARFSTPPFPHRIALLRRSGRKSRIPLTLMSEGRSRVIGTFIPACDMENATSPKFCPFFEAFNVRGQASLPLFGSFILRGRRRVTATERVRAVVTGCHFLPNSSKRVKAFLSVKYSVLHIVSKFQLVQLSRCTLLAARITELLRLHQIRHVGQGIFMNVLPQVSLFTPDSRFFIDRSPGQP